MFDEMEEIGSNRAIYRFIDNFKYQNVIIYLITLIVSMISIRNGLYLFGLAMVAACVGEEIPVFGAYVCALIGTIIGGGFAEVQTFFIVSFFYFLLVLSLKKKEAVEERNEQLKTGGKLFAAGVIYSAILFFRHKYTSAQLFENVLSYALMYSIYKVFVNGIQCIKNFKIRKVYTTEEVVATGVLFAIALSIFSNINILGISLYSIILFFMVMFISWRSSAINGVVGAIAIGVCSLLVTPISFFQIELLVLAGILSGILSYLGKYAVLGVLVLSGLVMMYGVGIENTKHITTIIEMCIAAVGLLFVPSRVTINIREMIQRLTYLGPSGDRRLKEYREPVNQKQNVLDMLSNLKNAKTRDDMEYFEDLLQDFLDNIEKVNKNIFYEIVADESSDIARDICKVLKENDIVIDSDVIAIFGSHNNYVILQDGKMKEDLQEIVRIANKTYKEFKDKNPEIVFKKSASKTKKDIVSEEQINDKNDETSILNTNISTKKTASGKEIWAGFPDNHEKKIEPEPSSKDLIDRLMSDIDGLFEETNSQTEMSLEKMIEAGLAIHDISLNSCEVNQISNGKYIAVLKFKEDDKKVKEKDIIKNIEKIISQKIGSKMVYQKEKAETSRGEYVQIYHSEDGYVLQVGNNKHIMDGQKYSTDSSIQIKLSDGKYLLALAANDTKLESARELNKSILRHVKQNTIKGFDEGKTFDILQSKLNKDTIKDSRLDVVVLDLFEGSFHLLKNNTTDIYIKNKKSIKIIKNDDATMRTSKFDLHDGDILILANEGIVDSNDNEKWVYELLKNTNTNNVQKMADIIVEEAIKNSFGITHDDMIVIVAKIVKRK
ncbi:MAG: SpoIIE family protein phosphatase [Clostridia bacterium]|nr:SpoIIE family protein phosphatase [Clostridia bacterium]